MSFNAFHNSWKSVANKLNNSTLQHAIVYWCEELGFDESESDSIRGNIQEWIQEQFIIKISLTVNNTFRFPSSCRNLLKFSDRQSPNGLNFNGFTQHIEDKRKFIEKRDNKDMLLLIAFVLVGIGFLLYTLDRNFQKKGQGRYNGLTNRNSVALVNQRSILVLVINVDREDLINKLKEKNRITEAYWEELYNATQFLWVGTESTLENSDIFDCFFRSNTENHDISEYDVYFIRVELSKPDPGFQPNVLQIDRRDAFQRLPEISEEICISHRLSSEAYSGKGFHNR